jgi:catechol 2,3-dioxygenase-like lactoylglutathione lyase family enzyme
MITGIHAVVYSKQAERVQAFLRDVLGLDWVDAGGNWPIFAAPNFEIGVHPTDNEPSHELFLVCDDVNATLATFAEFGVEQIEPVADRGWGLLTRVRLPGGDELGLYERRHASPYDSPEAGSPG